MNPQDTMLLGRQAIDLTIMLAGPLLLVALIIGLVISIFQAATQINEATLSFIPKLLGILIALIIAGPWMLTSFEDYFKLVLTNIASFGR
jgi:flagellar biosynthesis protein FliQ